MDKEWRKSPSRTMDCWKSAFWDTLICWDNMLNSFEPCEVVGEFYDPMVLLLHPGNFKFDVNDC